MVLATIAAQAAWLSARFILDVANISRGGGDLLDPLLVTAIVDANQAPLHSDLALQRAYGEAGHALPDEHRRPIPMLALAQSLRLPFETVRRRVRRLADQGVCRIVDGGAVVPQAVVISPPYLGVLASRVERLAVFEVELAAAGVLARTGATTAAGVRAADRALAAYMLRACDQLIALTGSAMAGFMLLGLAAANSDHLGGAEAPALDTVIATPASAADLSRRLHMPDETVRRNLFALADQGFARREGMRWLADAPPAAREPLGRIAADNQINLRRLFSRLAELSDPARRDAADRRA